MINKKQLREYYLAIRKNINDEERVSASNNIKLLFDAWNFFQNAKNIACYLSHKSEVDTEQLISHILLMRKNCFVPVIEKDKLIFARFTHDTKITPNHYAISEPTPPYEIIDLNQLDMIVLPLIAFDRQGNRLGTGGGYYDKTLSSLNPANKHRPLLVGLAFQNQEHENLPHENFDVRLDAIVTEKEIILVNSSA